MPHPRLQSYAETIERTFPLVLVIGREPNTDVPIAGNHSMYDFDRYPRCGFWNLSYSTIAATHQLSSAQLKAHCRTRRSSPILYGDALPIGLTHALRDKHTHRQQLQPSTIHVHITALFAFAPLLDRVQVVILSGLDGAVFQPARDAVAAIAAQRQLRVITLPFFFGTNAPRIQAMFATEDRSAIQQVVEAFLHAAPAP